jgi:hypothetical protein
MANDLNMRELLDQVRIARQHNPDVAQGSQSPGQGG